MKTFKSILASVLFTMLLSSCGGSKQAATPGGSTKGTNETAWGLDVELNECQLLTEEKPATRAYGEGVNARLSYAKAYAEGQARATLARAVASKIKAATKESDLQWNKYAGNATDGQTVTDEGSKADGLTHQIAEELIENAVIIKTNQYIQPNRQYHVFVCVEYQGEASQLCKKTVQKIEQQVSDEDRIKMEYQFKKFEESLEKEFADYAKERGR